MTAPRSALLALALSAGAAPAADPPTDNFGDPLPPGATARVGTARLSRPGVYAAVLTPHGKSLLMPVPGGAIERLDVATGRVVGTIGEKVADRTGRDFLHLSADGTRGVSAGDYSVLAWDAKTGQVLNRVGRQPPSERATVALSADGTTLAVAETADELGGRPLVVEVWDVGRPKRRVRVVVEEERLVSVALSPGGNVLATWSHREHRRPCLPREPDSPVQFWDATTGKPLGLFTLNEVALQEVVFTPDGKSAAVCDAKGVMLLIDPKTGKETGRLAAGAGRGGRVVFAPDGKTLAVCLSDGTVRLWDVAADKELSTTASPARLPRGLAASVVFVGDKRLVAWGFEGATAVVWEVPSGKRLSPRGLGEAPRSVVFTPDGKELLTDGPDWTVRRWDPATGKPLGERKLEVPAGINPPEYPGVYLPPGGTRAVATGSGVEWVYDAGTGKRLHDLAGRGGWARLDADAELLLTAVGVGQGQIPPAMGPVKMEVRELATGKALAEIELAGRELGLVARTPDRARLVTTVYVRHPDHPAKVVVTAWDLATGKKVGEVTEPAGAGGLRLSVGPGPVTLFTEAAGGLWVLDFATGKVTQRIDTGGLYPSAGPVFSPDGKRFALGLCDFEKLERGGALEVRVYDTASGKPLKTFTGHTGYIGPLAFSPDGKTLASGSFDTTILVWDLTTVGK